MKTMNTETESCRQERMRKQLTTGALLMMSALFSPLHAAPMILIGDDSVGAGTLAGQDNLAAAAGSTSLQIRSEDLTNTTAATISVDSLTGVIITGGTGVGSDVQLSNNAGTNKVIVTDTSTSVVGQLDAQDMITNTTSQNLTLSDDIVEIRANSDVQINGGTSTATTSIGTGTNSGEVTIGNGSNQLTVNAQDTVVNGDFTVNGVARFSGGLQVQGIDIDSQRTILSGGGADGGSITLDDKGASFANALTGAPSTVTGVADGMQDHDAVNRKQLNTAYAGIASVAAMAALPQPAPGRHFSLGLGTSYYQGESGVAMGMKGSLTDTTQYSLGGSYNSSGETLFSGGVGMSW